MPDDADAALAPASSAKRRAGSSRPDFTSDEFAPLVAILGLDSLQCLNDAKTYTFTWFKNQAAQHARAAGRAKPVGAFNTWAVIVQELLTAPADPSAEEDSAVEAAGMESTPAAEGDPTAVAAVDQPADAAPGDDDTLVEACALVEVLLNGTEFELPEGLTDEHYECLVKAVESRIAELEAGAAVQFEELKKNAESVENVCEVVKVIAHAHCCRITSSPTHAY